jgi:hypothetical protein
VTNEWHGSLIKQKIVQLLSWGRNKYVNFSQESKNIWMLEEVMVKLPVIFATGTVPHLEKSELENMLLFCWIKVIS